jgi:hypothetical protein
MAWDPATAILDIGKTIIERIWPDATEQAKAQIELVKLQQAGAFKELETSLEADKLQAAINLADAQSNVWWQAGWRPFIGWVCGFSLVWNYILRDMWLWIASMNNWVLPPKLDIGDLIAILIAMLGIGTMRSIDKKYFMDSRK